MIQQNGITCSLKMPKISSASCAFPTHGITSSHESSFPAIVWTSLFLESMRPSSRFQSILVVSSHSNLPTLTWLRDDSDGISCSERISIAPWASACTPDWEFLRLPRDFLEEGRNQTPKLRKQTSGSGKGMRGQDTQAFGKRFDFVFCFCWLFLEH